MTVILYTPDVQMRVNNLICSFQRRFSQFIARVLGPPASTFPIIKTFCDVKCSDDKNDQKVDQNNGRKLIKSVMFSPSFLLF